jgi:carbamoyltransferase
MVRSSGLFSRVFVPVNPGNAGLAVGAVLHERRSAPTLLSPFLGPAYTLSEIKATLDNCKLPYNLVTESAAVDTAIEALRGGRLVGWYEGAMEWGPRALGARSILANPFAPYVLENLNNFLKRREPWRGYALSTLDSAVGEHFSGPAEAPFMECDFRPRDVEKFRHVLPSPKAGIRVHVAGQEAPAGFRRLLAAFGASSGIPCVVNTSFNGFHEPIVCSPRDAIRVFFGSGIDVLILDRFVLTK